MPLHIGETRITYPHKICLSYDIFIRASKAHKRIYLRKYLNKGEMINMMSKIEYILKYINKTFENFLAFCEKYKPDLEVKISQIEHISNFLSGVFKDLNEEERQELAKKLNIAILKNNGEEK